MGKSKNYPYCQKDLVRIYGKEKVAEDNKIRRLILERLNYYTVDGVVYNNPFSDNRSFENQELIIPGLIGTITLFSAHRFSSGGKILVANAEDTICQLLLLDTTLVNFVIAEKIGFFNQTPFTASVGLKNMRIANAIMQHPNFDINFEYPLKTDHVLPYFPLMDSDDEHRGDSLMIPQSMVMIDRKSFDPEFILNGLYKHLLTHPGLSLTTDDYGRIIGVLNHSLLDEERRAEDIKRRFELMKILASRRNFKKDEILDYYLCMECLLHKLEDSTDEDSQAVKKELARFNKSKPSKR